MNLPAGAGETRREPKWSLNYCILPSGLGQALPARQTSAAKIMTYPAPYPLKARQRSIFMGEPSDA
jgi:hypothetical protein